MLNTSCVLAGGVHAEAAPASVSASLGGLGEFATGSVSLAAVLLESPASVRAESALAAVGPHAELIPNLSDLTSTRYAVPETSAASVQQPVLEVH